MSAQSRASALWLPRGRARARCWPAAREPRPARPSPSMLRCSKNSRRRRSAPRLHQAGPAGVGRHSGAGSPRRRCPATEAFSRSGRSLLTRTTSGALGCEIGRDGEDAAVVGVAAQPGRQRGEVPVVHLDAQRAPGVVDRDRLGEVAVLDAQRFEPVQHLAGGPAELRVVALGLQLADDRQRKHELVLLECAQRRRVGEQHAGVEHVREGARCQSISSRNISGDRAEVDEQSRIAFWSWAGNRTRLDPRARRRPRTPAAAISRTIFRCAHRVRR